MMDKIQGVCGTSAQQKVAKHPVGPIGISYSREASSAMFWHYLKGKVIEKVDAQGNNKRKVKEVKITRRMRQAAYHEPRAMQTISFISPGNIKCLRKVLDDIIGSGMADVPAINQLRYLGENDKYFLVICSEDYTNKLSIPKHLQTIRINFMWDGLTIGLLVVYHRHIYSSIPSADRLAN
jgi:hypothetical protein